MGVVGAGDPEGHEGCAREAGGGVDDEEPAQPETRHGCCDETGEDACDGE